MKKNNISIIGAGNMGEAIIKNIKNILVFDINKARLNYLNKKYKVKATQNIEDVIDSKIIILAVKPQSVNKLYKQLKNKISGKSVVVSILAGVSVKSISNGFNLKRVVRAMPNTPALINQGMTVWFAKNVDKKNKVIIKKIFTNLGLELEVNQEELIDKATAISGSGPAYFFYFIESYIKAAIKLGFSLKQTKQLVRQTIIGSIDLLDATGMSPKQLRGKVTSKKGTTEVAIKKMQENKYNVIIEKATMAAYKRAKEIKQQYE